MPQTIKVDLYEIELAQSLDMLITDGDLALALKILSGVSETFSQYDTYMEKVGLLIK